MKLGREIKKLVVVTGLPRSGTTVVGDILSAGAKSISVYEPMNPQSGDKRFDLDFPIPGEANFSEGDFDAFIADLMALKLDLRPGVFPHESGLRAMAKRIVGGRSRTSLRQGRLSPSADTLIWKDPFAMLCIPALLARDIDTVVTYRPAKANAASFKRLNWRFKTDQIAPRVRAVGWVAGAEPTTPQDHEGISAEVACAVYLWRLLAGVCIEIANKRSPRFTMVDTGALPSEPQEAFEEIFNRTGLMLDDNVCCAIEDRFAVQAGQTATPQGHPHARGRDPRAVNDYWRSILSQAEIDYIDSHCAKLEAQIRPHLFSPQRVEARAL